VLVGVAVLGGDLESGAVVREARLIEQVGGGPADRLQHVIGSASGVAVQDGAVAALADRQAGRAVLVRRALGAGPAHHAAVLLKRTAEPGQPVAPAHPAAPDSGVPV